MHGSSASMDADAGVGHNPPTLLQMSISRESDTTTTSEISVFEDSIMSPEITDRNDVNDSNEDSLYSPEERQYNKLKKVQELSVVAETTTSTPPQRRRPHSPRRQAHSTSKFYVDGLSNNGLSGINTRKISVPARHHLPKSEKERVRKVKYSCFIFFYTDKKVSLMKRSLFGFYVGLLLTPIILSFNSYFHDTFCYHEQY